MAKRAKGQNVCAFCRKPFKGRRKLCSASCVYRYKADREYFGGRMRSALGWADKECQVCRKTKLRHFNVHHVNGYPDHSELVVLCRGCHQVISILARRKMDREHMVLLIDYALRQREGKKRK